MKTVFVLFLSSFITSALACQSGSLFKTGLQPGEKNIILTAHNQFRDRIAQGRVYGLPGAEYMYELQWDEELAGKAQKWADNCEFRHSSNRVTGRFPYGENLAILRSTGITKTLKNNSFREMIQMWFDEVKLYRFGARFSSQTGHFTQMIWADTNLIGCGYSYYKKGGLFTKLYVCTYGPGGNIEGKNPYNKGTPSCSKYGLKSSQHYTGLCSSSSSQFFDDNSLKTEQRVPEYYGYEPQYNQQQFGYGENPNFIENEDPSGYFPYKWGNVFEDLYRRFPNY